MIEYKLANKIKEIEMPEDMQQRILMNCCLTKEERNMKSKMRHFVRPATIAAAFCLVLCLTGVTAMASMDKIEGFFKDIFGSDGAIVGMTYEQATDEIELNLIRSTDELVIEAIILEPNSVPYSEFEMFGINSYVITDEKGNLVDDLEKLSILPIGDGSVCFSIPLNNLSSGSYTLTVTEFIGSKKADQPLILSGLWEIDFIYSE